VCCVSVRLLVGIALQHFSDRPTILVGEWWQPVHLLTLGALPLSLYPLLPRHCDCVSTFYWTQTLNVEIETAGRQARQTLAACASLFAASSSSAISPTHDNMLNSDPVERHSYFPLRCLVSFNFYLAPLNSLLNEVGSPLGASAPRQVRAARHT
jgi:hypothetical protein